MITRRLFYRMIKTVVVALLSGECLIMMHQVNEQQQPDLLIDSFNYREGIVNLIMRFNRSVNVVYKE